MPAVPTTYDAVVLAGGRGRRMGGVDKPALEVGGVALLDRVLDAAAGAARTVVVGPPRPTRRAVTWTREEPPGGGPVAALAAGLALVTADVVVVLAADLPHLHARHVCSLVTAAERTGAAVVVGDGREQPLMSAWCTALLRERLPADPVGARAMSLVPDSATLVHPADLPAAWQDCDTPEDLAVARALLAAGA